MKLQLDGSTYHKVFTRDSVFASFSSLIGLFLAFRASQAYTRYREGATAVRQMVSEIFEACSSLVAFTKMSMANQHDIIEYRHMVVRFYSMLNALMMADIGASAARAEGLTPDFHLSYELIDAKGIDHESLEGLRQTDMKIDYVYHWIQTSIIEAEACGILAAPAPILSRVFQEMNSVMLHYHEARQLSEAPFPAPYSAATKVVLLIIWFLTPLVAPLWVDEGYIMAAAMLAFIQVFMLWSLDAIADELENPFGDDANDLELSSTHEELNDRLLHLLQVAETRAPQLRRDACKDTFALRHGAVETFRPSFADIWESRSVEPEDGLKHRTYLKRSSLKLKREASNETKITPRGDPSLMRAAYATKGEVTLSARGSHPSTSTVVSTRGLHPSSSMLQVEDIEASLASYSPTSYSAAASPRDVTPRRVPPQVPRIPLPVRIMRDHGEAGESMISTVSLSPSQAPSVPAVFPTIAFKPDAPWMATAAQSPVTVCASEVALVIEQGDVAPDQKAPPEEAATPYMAGHCCLSVSESVYV